MTTKGKSWKWKKDAPGRKTASLAMTAKLKSGTCGRPFTKKHGLSKTPEYNAWKKMMGRCYKESDPYFYCYGERGITVCDAWHDVRQFVEDMGPRPVIPGTRMSLERVDVDKNYEPGNCVWLPLKMQSQNRRSWKHTEAGLKSIGEATRERNFKRTY